MSAQIIPFPAPTPAPQPTARPKTISGAAATTELTPRMYPHVPFDVVKFTAWLPGGRYGASTSAHA